MLKRKLISWVILSLLLTLFLTTVLHADGLPFRDVPAGAWYYDDVKTAYETRLINGKTGTLYAPDDHMTAAEAVKLAACMHQLKKEGAVSLSPGSAVWYQPYVDYAKDNDIIAIDLPWNQNINRAGYMQIFAQLIKDDEAGLNDVPNDSIPDVRMMHPGAAAIYKLYRAGIVQGVDADKNCKPESFIKRSEVAAILTRMMDASRRLRFVEPEELTITKEPESIQGDPGTRVELKVEVKGGKEPLSYQWEYLDEITGNFKKSTSEGNTANVLKAPVEVKAYEYRCVIRDADGKQVVSNRVKVEEFTAEALTITENPKPRLGKIGEIVKLKVEVSGGGGPVSYQWQYSEDVNGPFCESKAVGNNTKELTVAIENKAYYFRCLIKDGARKPISSAIVLVSNSHEVDPAALRITNQPIDMGALEGQEVMLGVKVAGGTAPYTYQWEYSENGRTNFFPSRAKGNHTDLLKVAAEGTIYYYRCVVKDKTGGTVTSDVAKVQSVGTYPFKIKSQPKDIRVNLNADVILEIELTGGKKPYFYQWQYLDSMQFKDVKVQGSKTNRMKTKLNENYTLYRCIVRDSNGNRLISDTAVVSQNDYRDFYVEKQSQNVSGNVGDEVVLKIDVDGIKRTKSRILDYQWFYLEYGDDLYRPSKAPGNDTGVLRTKVEEKIYDYLCVIYDDDDDHKEVLMSKPIRVKKRNVSP